MIDGAFDYEGYAREMNVRPEGVDIRRSSFCYGGECVRVTFDDDLVEVSDSSGYRHVLYTFDEWRAFIAGVKNGEFEVPSDD